MLQLSYSSLKKAESSIFEWKKNVINPQVLASEAINLGVEAHNALENIDLVKSLRSSKFKRLQLSDDLVICPHKDDAEKLLRITIDDVDCLPGTIPDGTSYCLRGRTDLYDNKNKMVVDWKRTKGSISSFSKNQLLIYSLLIEDAVSGVLVKIDDDFNILELGSQVQFTPFQKSSIRKWSDRIFVKIYKHLQETKDTDELSKLVCEKFGLNF